MTLPHHRHLTATAWAWLGFVAFWVAVVLLLARCA